LRFIKPHKGSLVSATSTGSSSLDPAEATRPGSNRGEWRVGTRRNLSHVLLASANRIVGRSRRKVLPRRQITWTWTWPC